MVVYVDDILMVAKLTDTMQLWAALDRNVKFKDAAEEIGRYLGANYEYSRYDPKQPNAIRTVSIDMDGYATDATARFERELLEKDPKARLTKVTSPHLPPEVAAQLGVSPGLFTSSCSSHVATLLFLYRVARPDVAVATQRLCTVVTKWTTTHDLALIRIFSYLRHAGQAKLKGTLSPDDLNDLVLTAWSDADWAGESEHTQSTGGLWLELTGTSSGRCWPISWGVKKQTMTASSSAESETVALSSNIRHETIPILDMLAKMLGSNVPEPRMLAKVDNTQAISAVTKGFSKKLRYLERCHRCAIGVLHELYDRGELEVEYAETSSHKGDGFTKALQPAKFLRARELMAMACDN